MQEKQLNNEGRAPTARQIRSSRSKLVLRGYMVQSSRDQAKYEELDLRLRTILPEEYQDCYEDIQPVSMGSAPLKLGRDGKVAWNQIWESFCDLAMAGGPPHKGMLLEPGSQAAINAQPSRYQEAVKEICRGIALTTELAAAPSPTAGWVRGGMRKHRERGMAASGDCDGKHFRPHRGYRPRSAGWA